MTPENNGQNPQTQTQQIINPSDPQTPQQVAPNMTAQPQMTQSNQTAVSLEVSDCKTLGIVGFVLAFFMPVAGIVVSAIALRKAKKIGFKNVLALIGLITSIVFTVLGVLMTIIVTIFIFISMAYVSSGNFIIGSWDQTASGSSNKTLTTADDPDFLQINSDKTMVWYHDMNDKSKDFATGTYTIEYGNKTNDRGQYNLGEDIMLYTLTFKLKEYVDTEGETHSSSREIVYMVMYDPSKSTTFSAVGVDALDSYTFVKE